jgi:ion channel
MDGHTLRNPHSLSHRLERLKGRSRYLLISLLALILLYPLIPGGRLAGYLVLAVNSIVLVAAVYSVADRRKHIIAGISLAIPQFVLSTIGLLSPDGSDMETYLGFADTFVLCIFYGYVIKRIVHHISRSKTVTSDIIYSALSVYLLMGLIWSTIYAMLEMLVPNSFHLNVDLARHGGLELIYFSFVTLTTLGYGDITPLTNRARSLAILQTVTGQLYLAVMIAWLVSRYKGDHALEPEED